MQSAAFTTLHISDYFLGLCWQLALSVQINFANSFQILQKMALIYKDRLGRHFLPGIPNPSIWMHYLTNPGTISYM